MALTHKQQVFIEEYLITWNATEAARRAGYAHPNKRGPELVVNRGIAEVIQARLADRALAADEVLARLAEQARATFEDFLQIDEQTGAWCFDFEKAKHQGKLHLIKKLLVDNNGISLELYSAQHALYLIGKHYKLFVTRHESAHPADASPLFVVKALDDPATQPAD